VKINSQSGNQIKLQSNKHKYKHSEKCFQKIRENNPGKWVFKKKCAEKTNHLLLKSYVFFIHPPNKANFNLKKKKTKPENEYLKCIALNLYSNILK